MNVFPPMLKSIPWLSCYDGEGDAAAAAAKAATDKAAADAAAAGAGAGDESVKDQNQLNAVLKREKEKFRQEREKLIKQLETIQTDARTSSEAKAQLEAQLEELRSANMTAEERAAIEKKKVEREYGEKLTAKEKEALTWQQKHHDLHIGYDISSAATIHDVVPSGIQFLESYLKPKAKLVEKIDPDTNKGTGDYVAKVKVTLKGKEDKPMEMELTIPEAIKAMKDQPEDFGFLFKNSSAGGLGAGSGTPGKKPNVRKMTQQEYHEARKKNPASVGL